MAFSNDNDTDFEKRRPSVESKALRINLNPSIYGTFAEIGGGQEVARHFFRVGAASGTIAKTISAYDKILVTTYMVKRKMVDMLQRLDWRKCWSMK